MQKANRGVLLAISSLPGNHGIGDFGENAFSFIDWLKANHYKYWQILPINPIGPHNSPYMSPCSYAIEQRYICLDYLSKIGLIKKLPTYKSKCQKVDYDKVLAFKRKYLKEAYLNYVKGNTEAFRKFKNRNKWIYAYATYEVLKRKNNNLSWNEWKIEHRDYFASHQYTPKGYTEEIDFEMWIQYIAYKQWKAVLSYARSKNIFIISDMPFYVGFDSVEVWTHRELFSIDENCNLFECGGVGPDAFSETGQLWGTPIYNFEKMKEDGYSFLIDRIVHLLNLSDYLRIDHFRAFDTYYVIPMPATDARNGTWKLGPSYDFFDRLFTVIDSKRIIAEDLGELRNEVHILRDHYNLPGMYVNQFMLVDSGIYPNGKQVVYTGTHDNDTTLSWFKKLNPEQKEKLYRSIKGNRRDRLFEQMMHFIYKEPSYITIIPMVDLLKLDSEARFNTPGTVNESNWTWKLKNLDMLTLVKYPKRSWK